MTLKYESEILFDLMKRDGDDTPSDVLPYESELKEKYLEQVEGAYPKLQDYRSEWLNYNLVAHLPADFPVETLSNVTRATVDNVVPYAYGSAILKGNTLVNIHKKCWMNVTSGESGWYSNIIRDEGKLSFDIDSQPSSTTWKYINAGILNLSMVKPNTKYLIIFSNSQNLAKVSFKRTDGLNEICTAPAEIENNRAIITTTNEIVANEQILYVSFNVNPNTTVSIETPMIIEYQEGIENWDIPYFEGMQSVNMPVLCTTGKNLFDKSKVKYNTTINADTGKEEDNDHYMSSDFISVNPNENYVSNNMGVIFFYNENKQCISRKNNSTVPQKFTTPANCKYIRVRSWSHYTGIEQQKEVVKSQQLEQGTQATPYEPFKSNILTVNEEVELRGFGEVKDELDLMTGELTQRIGEVVLDGSEPVRQYGSELIEVYKVLPTTNQHILGDAITSNGYKVVNNYNFGRDKSISYHSNATCFYIRDSNETAETLKEKLSKNPITLQYKLATESIKTVDLTVTDQDGKTESIIRPIEGTMHLMTEGDTIKPLFSGEIPVEATTQNLASFIKEE